MVRNSCSCDHMRTLGHGALLRWAAPSSVLLTFSLRNGTGSRSPRASLDSRRRAVHLFNASVIRSQTVGCRVMERCKSSLEFHCFLQSLGHLFVEHGFRISISFLVGSVCRASIESFVDRAVGITFQLVAPGERDVGLNHIPESVQTNTMEVRYGVLAVCSLRVPSHQGHRFVPRLVTTAETLRSDDPEE